MQRYICTRTASPPPKEVEDPHQGKEVAVGIHFDLGKLDTVQRCLLWGITRGLLCLGISFDTGSDGKTLDWEWDWSLKGPVRVKFRNFVEDDSKNRYMRELEKGKEEAPMPDIPARAKALEGLEKMVEELLDPCKGGGG